MREVCSHTPLHFGATSSWEATLHSASLGVALLSGQIINNWAPYSPPKAPGIGGVNKSKYRERNRPRLQSSAAQGDKFLASGVFPGSCSVSPELLWKYRALGAG